MVEENVHPLQEKDKRNSLCQLYIWPSVIVLRNSFLLCCCCIVAAVFNPRCCCLGFKASIKTAYLFIVRTCMVSKYLIEAKLVTLHRLNVKSPTSWVDG